MRAGVTAMRKGTVIQFPSKPKDKNGRKGKGSLDRESRMPGSCHPLQGRNDERKRDHPASGEKGRCLGDQMD